MSPVDDGGKEFARLRKDLGLTQKEAAVKLDRSVGWIRKIEQEEIPCPAYAIYSLRYLKAQQRQRKR